MTLYSSPRLSLPPVSLIIFIDVGILHCPCNHLHKLILTFKLDYVLIQEEFVPLLDLVDVSLSQLEVVLQAIYW